MKIMRFILLFTLLVSLTACKNLLGTAAYEPEQNASEQLLFRNGEVALAKGNYETAVKSFDMLLAQYPYGKYSQQARVDLIYAYYKNGDAASAGAEAERYVHLYPRAKNAAYAYYIQGLANFTEGRGFLTRYAPLDLSARNLTSKRAAYKNFSILVRRFPHSKYAPDAKEHMIFLRNLFAQHELNIAEYYLKRKVYLAAANRASIVVQQYSQSPQTQRALVIIEESNRHLGLPKQADEARRILQLNYSNSRA